MQTINMRMLILALSALAVAGCQTVDELSKENSAATVEDQGISPAEMEAMDAQAGGADKGGYPNADVSGGGRGGEGARVIYFEYDSDEIRPEFRSAIEAHAAYIASHPGTVITLEGHADERGSREYNLALGERRALAVRKQITLLGGSASQVRSVSYGEEHPNSPGHDESAYALNRRVEISY
ncbi:MAG: peptidoglycan-associated lipoprotein Pal [Gammaproteobacteria bacterium]